MPRKKKDESTSIKDALKTKPAPIAKVAKSKPAAAKKVRLKVTKEPSTKKAIAAPRAKKVSAPKVEGAALKKSVRKGETQMVAFIRDPHCIFTYWEVTPESIESVRKQLTEEYKNSTMVLRVFRTGSDGKAELIEEIRVEPGEMNRYVNLKENSGSYFIEIAQKTASGKTVVYARSNRVVTGTSAEHHGGAKESKNSTWETPAGILEYFSETEETTVPLATGGISSAEAHRRTLARKKMDRYSASRMG